VTDVEAVWIRYRDGDPAARNELIETYAGLVKAVAAGEPVRSDIEKGDLAGFGFLGLLDAMERFDPTRGLKFESYAVARIKGSIRDEVRRSHWVPEKVHRRTSAVSRATSVLEGKLGRSPTVAEVADELDMTVEALEEIVEVSERVNLKSLDEKPNTNTINDGVGSAGSLSDLLAGANLPAPEASFDVEEIRMRLASAIASLPTLARVVLALRYREHLEYGQMAAVIGVKRTRACQLHTEAVEALRLALAGAHVDAFLGGA
jgi:RNA polymerase sigma factor for flagellar operon FliA